MSPEHKSSDAGNSEMTNSASFKRNNDSSWEQGEKKSSADAAKIYGKKKESSIRKTVRKTNSC